ncbi:unnamed protein product [Meloidogyne enterolobii]|uniref:Uncharacterized protein n=1 Tax=Meloidogyne enterolobii TaxID=390850 RepID=A0ACB0YET9_MELEN
MIGRGTFGGVFLVRTKVKDSNELNYAAMKVESLRRNREEEVLEAELYVLLKMQGISSFCTIYKYGRIDKLIYVVMTLLGQDIGELRRMQPRRRFSAATTLRIGIQLLKALCALHSEGFVHRDLKPASIAVGHKSPDVIYLFDFGWAHYIYRDNAKTELKQPRERIPFCGTYRYCSLNAQMCMEQGRVDDLWSVLVCFNFVDVVNKLLQFILAECRRRKLPWSKNTKDECQRVKEWPELAENLLEGCPPSLTVIFENLNLLGFFDRPDYELFIQWLEDDLETDPGDNKNVFDWQREGYSAERVKIDEMTGSDTQASLQKNV